MKAKIALPIALSHILGRNHRSDAAPVWETEIWDGGNCDWT